MAIVGPRQYPPHPSGRERFSSIGPGRGNQGITSTLTRIEIQGANVLYEHFMAAAALVEATMPEILNVVGDLGVEHARSLVPYDTGATHDSITIVGGSSKSVSRTSNLTGNSLSQWWVDIGPETFYAPFLEWGTVNMTPRPFMIPAADLMEVVLVASVNAIMNVVIEGQSASLSGGGGAAGSRVLSDPRVANPFSSLRGFLYSSAKALGDISIIGGRGIFGPLRSSMYSLARGLGDVGSIMNQTLSTRITNRLRGRVTGRIIGFGSASLSFGKTYSAFPGGAAGHRVYQRFLGSHTSLAGVSAFGSSSLIDKFFG